MSNYKLTTNNTICIQQRDYKGNNRHFNYQTGYKFIPFQTTMMIADASTLAGGALSGDGFLYIGCSDTIPMADLKKVCAFSDLGALSKKMSKLSQRKAKRLQNQYHKSYAQTYNIAMNSFIEWCVDNEMSESLFKYFLNDEPTTDDGSPLSKDDWKALTEMFFAMDTGINPKTGKNRTMVQPTTFQVSTLNPIRNFEGMDDAKLLFFLDNIKGKMPHLLCVVYSEKENYYGLDDITYYEFSYLPNAITSVLHPSQQELFGMWKSHLSKRLNGAILSVESNKGKQGGQDIQIVTDVLDYCNGYAHIVANHQDTGYTGIKIATEKGDITAPSNQYRWWIPLDEAVSEGSCMKLITSDFGSTTMDVAFLGEMRRDEMMRSASILYALPPCGKNRTSSRQDLWSNGEMKAEVKK